MKRLGPVLLLVMMIAWADVWPVAAQGGEGACPALGREDCDESCPLFNNMPPTGAPWYETDPTAVGYAQHPLHSARTHALIGRIGGGPPFEVGGGGTFTAYADGALQFRLNDWDVADNQGSFTVVISP